MESKGPQSHTPPRRTALEAHVAFFDTDKDDIIWPTDTFKGFMAIGFGVFLSLFSMVVIHFGFSYLTFGTLLPDPFLRIRVSNIHGALHGSDSGAYTQTGDFDERRFNYVFSLYTAEPHTHMTFSEGVRMVHGNRNAYDPFGWFAAIFEWGSVYLLFWPEDGRVAKNDVQNIFNGTLFHKLATKNANAKKAE